MRQFNLFRVVNLNRDSSSFDLVRIPGGPKRYPTETHLTRKMKHATLAVLLLLTINGCDSGTLPNRPIASSPIANESDMHNLASNECMIHVLKSVDRPFDATPEVGSIWIDPEDPVLAQCVMHCTHDVDGSAVRSLFLVTFDNQAYPGFADVVDELHCVLVNCDGKVIFKDEEYWEGDTHEELLEAGAADSDSPPFIAIGILEMAALRKKYSTP